MATGRREKSCISKGKDSPLGLVLLLFFSLFSSGGVPACSVLPLSSSFTSVTLIPCLFTPSASYQPSHLVVGPVPLMPLHQKGWNDMVAVGCCLPLGTILHLSTKLGKM
eukprot:Sspe_Gene.46618::Locus_23325_Transcript_1_1_Confidence_1.000_Length_542::g.46618::m.46618